MAKTESQSIKKEIIFTCLGFLLGIISTILTQQINDYKALKNTALILKSSIGFELRLSKLLYENRSVDTDNQMIHNPRVFYDIRSDIGKLHEDVIDQVIAFDSSLLQCLSSRNIIKNKLAQCNFFKTGTYENSETCKESFGLYMGVLDVHIKTTERLLELLEKHPPGWRSFIPF